jgi:hypothetical protein
MEFKKITGYKSKALGNVDDGIDFIMSSANPDRTNEIIVPSAWDLTSFKSNPICLYQHDPDEPIGRWENVKVVKNQLVGTLFLADQDTSDDINAIRALVGQNILRAVSVGFMVNKWEFDEKKDALVYTDVELLECSLVSIPCNDECMSIAKKFNADPKKLFSGFNLKAGVKLATTGESKLTPNAIITSDDGKTPKLEKAKFYLNSFKRN